MKTILLGLAALTMPFIFAGFTVYAQTTTQPAATDTSAPTTTSTTDDVTIPSGAPRTGFGSS